jgi:hypothetical protein
MFPSNLTCISWSHILLQVTTVALSASTVAHLAIGLGDGTVILYRHLDQSQDRIEEIILWKRGWLRTTVWMASYAFLCSFQFSYIFEHLTHL